MRTRRDCDMVRQSITATSTSNGRPNQKSRAVIVMIWDWRGGCDWGPRLWEFYPLRYG
jgi:hypothetical protein